MIATIARYADSSGAYTIRLDGDVLWTSIDSGGWVESFAYRIAPASSTDVDWSEWMLTPRFGSTPDGGEGHGFVWIDGDEFVLVERLETTEETEIRADRRERCPGTSALPDLSLPSGWPYGRVECDACGSFVFRNRDGALRAHLPRDPYSETAFERERRAALQLLRSEVAR